MTSFPIADKILSSLQGVRETGTSKWLACCPAHEDKTPSLSIREIDDRVLLHCFAGCDAHSIVSAVGLELSDLFPERIPCEGNKKLSKPFPAVDILRALNSDIAFISLCASDIAQGANLQPKEISRLFEAASRFRAALLAGSI